jgi:hypothetical protein
MVLGEHGFIGLGIYLLICAVCWRNLQRVRKLTAEKGEVKWAHDLGFALQVSMVGFLVGGAALPMAYYDGFFTLLAMTTALLRLVQTAAAPAEERRPAGFRRTGPAAAGASATA